MAASGVFETMRVYDGCVFAQEEHLKRMINACPAVGIKPPEKGLLKLAIKSIIEEKRLRDARLRLKLLNIGGRSQIVVTAQKLGGLKKAASGLSVLVVEAEKMARSCLNGVKTLDRAFYDGIYRKAKSRGYDEGIFLNMQGDVVEGSRTNIFIIKNGAVTTPGLSSGCLPGVTRRIVMGILTGMKITCREKRVSPGELFGADGVFLTNSVIEVAPVALLDKKIMNDVDSQGLIDRIISAYKKEVEKRCGLR